MTTDGEGYRKYGENSFFIECFIIPLRQLVPLAKQGTAAAQCNIGLKHALGEGMAQDPKTALKWFRRSAENGYAHAQYLLGEMYFWGAFVPKNYKKAMKWYQLAAKQGHAEAQCQTGLQYSCNIPGSKNHETALKNYEAALKWYRLGAKQGHVRSQYDLNLMCALLREGLPQDLTKWCNMSVEAERVEAHAQFRLGLMFSLGLGAKLDWCLAEAFFRRAAEQGYTDAQFILGLTYEVGLGLPLDNIYAHMWLNIAASSGECETASENRDRIAKGMTPADISTAQKRARQWISKNANGVA